MQLSIIYLMSLLLIPTLVASKSYSPPPDPEHGDIVHYQWWSGPRLGVVVGSQRPRESNLNIAPLIPGSPHPPARVRTYQRQLVNTPPGHVVSAGHTAQSRALATTLEREHSLIPPSTFNAPGPVRGSRNHQAVQSNGRNRSSERAGGH